MKNTSIELLKKENEMLIKEVIRLRGEVIKTKEYYTDFGQNIVKRMTFATECMQKFHDNMESWQMQALYVNAMASNN